MGTFSGERKLCQNSFCFPAGKGSSLKGKNLLPFGSRFFPFRVDSFQKGLGLQERKQKVVSLAKMTKNFPSASSPFISC